MGFQKFYGQLYYLGKHRVTLDGSGDGSQAITFDTPFYGTPQATVVGHKGDSGSYTATSVSKTGATITISSSDILSQDIEVTLFAMEKH